MKVLVYCQHVVGIGHLVRILEIIKALYRHEVVLVTGGPPAPLPPPPNTRHVQLPPLAMDRQNGGLYSPENRPLDQVRHERLEQLFGIFRSEAPDLFLVELYPFGRRAFRHELDPVLDAIRTGTLPPATVACSVRDILVEKPAPEKSETRTVRVLNKWFDVVWVHADPSVVRLDETFSRLKTIAIPVWYTGYIAPKFDRSAMHHKSRGSNPKRVVVSTGGGLLGIPLLRATIDAWPLLEKEVFCNVYTGPYLNEHDFAVFEASAPPGLSVKRFTPDLPGEMARADLSISLAGYNTSMNILATGTPALVWPYDQDREQGLRAKRLAREGCLRVLSRKDLAPPRLADILTQSLEWTAPCHTNIRIDGADTVAKWVDLGFPREGPGLQP